MQVELAKQWEVWEESFDLTRQTGDESQPHHGFDPALVLTLQVLTTNKASFKNFKTTRRVLVRSMDLLAVSLLREIVIQRQRDYSTTVAEDIMLLQDNLTQGRQRVAVEIRLGEKEILASTLQYAERRAEYLSLDSSTSLETKDELALNGQISKRKKI